jgi:hypothetical protein
VWRINATHRSLLQELDIFLSANILVAPARAIAPKYAVAA